MIRTRIAVLGAGFGGLELTTILSEAFGDTIDIVLVDEADAFVFGFSKLDVMFGRQLPEVVRHKYCDIVKPGVRFLQSTVRSIDPAARRVATDDEIVETDVLVIALGADLDLAATPGLIEGGHEFYTVAGAFALREVLPRFERGPAIIGVMGKPFQCPPAPSETALLLHDYLTARGRREATDISVVMPFGTPIPPSPDTSQAILAAFAERGIRFVKDSLVKALDPARKVAVLSDGTEMPYELFLGVPVHRVPQVVVESGLAASAYDWVAVDQKTLETRFPAVYAVGDVNGVGTPKAGVFAEGASRVVAAAIIAKLRGGPPPEAYTGQGSCYVEFGRDQVGRVDIDFLSGPKPTGTFEEPSTALVKERHVSHRAASCVGLDGQRTPEHRPKPMSRPNQRLPAWLCGVGSPDRTSMTGPGTRAALRSKSDRRRELELVTNCAQCAARLREGGPQRITYGNWRPPRCLAVRTQPRTLPR